MEVFAFLIDFMHKKFTFTLEILWKDKDPPPVAWNNYTRGRYPVEMEVNYNNSKWVTRFMDYSC